MTKIPKQLYVTAKDSHPGQPDEPLLGFINAYEPGKAAFEKKKLTQIGWSYHPHNLFDFTLTEGNGKYLVTGWKWAGSSASTRYKEVVAKEPEFPPTIWDNDPLTGFKVLHSVGRHSTSNKLWRILDPRGIQLEITTACMAQLMQDTTILKGGIIESPCVWVSNKNLIVAP